MLKRHIFALSTLILATALSSTKAQDAIPINLIDCEHGQLLYLPESAQSGAFVYFSVQPDNGYELAYFNCYQVTEEAGQTSRVVLPVDQISGMQFGFTMPECNWVEINAYFREITYIVTIKDNIQHGTVELCQTNGFVYGEPVRLKATPDAEYLFNTALISTEAGFTVPFTTSGAEDNAIYIDFYMPKGNVTVNASFKPVPRYSIVIPEEIPHGAISSDYATAKPGDTVTFTVTSADSEYALKSIKISAGYEITGGSGGVHGPHSAIKDLPLWYLLEEFEATKIDRTHFQFTLPLEFNNVLTPIYVDGTEFRLSVEFVHVGPQVIYCADNTTLYFNYSAEPDYLVVGDNYDGHTVSEIWSGDIVTDTGWTRPGWSAAEWTGKANISTVVFEEGFADMRPKSCYSWFYGFSGLTGFVGLDNLNTSQVTNMNSMFHACSALTSIDVNSFDVGSVTNASTMFRACNQLTTIYCDNTWNIPTTSMMFLGDSNLVGAAHYSAEQIEGEMANPTNGYFTGNWSITISSEIEHGSIACDKNRAYTNETVTITVTPNEGYDLDSLTIETPDANSGTQLLNSLRSAIIPSPGEDPDTYTFVMPPSSVSINATFKKSTSAELVEKDPNGNIDAKRYNIVGQPVGTDYKGIVIVNGRKIVVK